MKYTLQIFILKCKYIFQSRTIFFYLILKHLKDSRLSVFFLPTLFLSEIKASSPVTM